MGQKLLMRLRANAAIDLVEKQTLGEAVSTGEDCILQNARGTLVVAAMTEYEATLSWS